MVDYMRISDWSSDVCSSDLETGAARFFFCKTPDFEDARFLKTKEPKMSRAFVKEDDAGTQEVQVDLPMSEHPNFVTPAGLKMLRDKVKEFEDERARLREHEDELATQSHLPRVEQELRYWEERLSTAIAIDLDRQPRDKVRSEC